MKAKKIVIAESPSKSRTLAKILGKDFVVKASYGHISDLPKSRLGFDPDNNFEPEFSVTRDKVKVVRDLKSYIDKNTIVYLASDDDAEGHAIAYHLYNVLKLKNNTVHRVIFHEITKEAILHAIDNPIEMKTNLAWQAIARRILDRAVGYKLSPLLWKKIKYGLSAGRVQSVALRIIVDLEKRIRAFEPVEFWKLKLDILSHPKFKAELAKIDGKKAVVSNETMANEIKSDCEANRYVLTDVTEKDSLRNPPPPFTTSTLQQVASSKAGFGVKHTMTIAQKLYEGSISVPGHTGGLITYMRTDSVNLSDTAIKMINSLVTSEYGSEYNISTPRIYKTKSKGAQEAHEAIRPVNMGLKPSDLVKYLDAHELKLYTLIWARAMATQMAPAKVSNTTYKITAGSKEQYEYIAKGTKILFPGFLKAYSVGKDTEDENDNDEKFLPDVPKSTVFSNTKLTTEQNFTKPPSRYSEASLVKKLETEGIGRPSTYASTISTIITREYVERTKDKKLQPTLIGEVVSDYLVKNFPGIVDLKFTSNMETELDKVGSGEIKWQEVMTNFYGDFVKHVESLEGTDRVQYSTSKVLGKDPVTGLDIILRTSQNGSYLQLGEQVEGSDKKPRVSPLPSGINANEITYEDALTYIKLPRVLGQNKNGYDITASIGRFGSLLLCNKSYYSLKEDDVYTITLERAKEIIKERDDAKAKALWLDFPTAGISVINGMYNPYIAVKKGKKKTNYKIPKNLNLDEDAIKKMSLSDIQKIIDSQPNAGKKFKGKKK